MSARIQAVVLKPRASMMQPEIGDAEIRLWGGSRPAMWVGSADGYGCCRLTRGEMEKLRDALNVALGVAP